MPSIRKKFSINKILLDPNNWQYFKQLGRFFRRHLIAKTRRVVLSMNMTLTQNDEYSFTQTKQKTISRVFISEVLTCLKT